MQCCNTASLLHKTDLQLATWYKCACTDILTFALPYNLLILFINEHLSGRWRMFVCVCVCVCLLQMPRAPPLLASIKRFLFYYVPCCRSCNKCCDQLLYNITIAAALAIATTTSESLDSNHEILVWCKKRTLSRSLGKRCLQMRACMRVCVCVYEWTGIAFLL